LNRAPHFTIFDSETSRAVPMVGPPGDEPGAGRGRAEVDWMFGLSLL